MPKTTPAQNRLLRLLQSREYYDNGLPLDEIRGVAHDKTIAGLERRGMAVVMADRLFLVTQR